MALYIDSIFFSTNLSSPDISYCVPSIGHIKSFPRRPPDLLIQAIIFAGLPTTKAKSGISFVTTAPAPIKQYFPRLFPQTIVALAPMDAPFPTIVFLYSSFLTISDLGLITLVNTHEGPQKTLSSRVTPS